MKNLLHGIPADYDVAPRSGGMTYREIAFIEGISFKRVFQIEQRALRKLREAFKRQGITSFYSAGK